MAQLRVPVTSHKELLQRYASLVPIVVELPLIAFGNDDRSYTEWVSKNPRGYVVNTYQMPSPSYLVLHWADCWTISRTDGGPWTTSDYAKVCGPDIAALEAWAKNDVNGVLSKCDKCWA